MQKIIFRNNPNKAKPSTVGSPPVVMPSGKSPEKMREPQQATETTSVFLIFCFSAILAGAFAPIFPRYYIICGLAIFGHLMRKKEVLWMMIVCAFFSAVSVSSRIYGHIHDDDFARYYEFFHDVISGRTPWFALFENEPGLGLVFLIQGTLFSGLSGAGLMFLNSFGLMLIFSCLVYTYFLKRISLSHIGICAAVFLLFMNPLIFTQLIRQLYSTVFLLPFLFSRNYALKVLYFVIATSFHLSAAYLFLFYLFAKALPKRFYYLFAVVCFALATLIPTLFYMFGSLLSDLPGLSKLWWHLGDRELSISFRNLLFTTVSLAGGLFWIYRHPLFMEYRTLFLTMILLSFSSILYPTYGLRIGLLYGAVLQGLLLALIFYRLKPLLLFGVFGVCAIFVHLELRFIMAGVVGDGFRQLWFTYDPVGLMPFYYVLHFFSR